MSTAGRVGGHRPVGQGDALRFGVWSLAAHGASRTLAAGIGGRSPRPCAERLLALVCPGVMPPDEYHPGVDNSAYTNVLVQNRSDPRPLPKFHVQGASLEG